MSKNNINRAISLTSYFYSLPSTLALFTGIILVGLIFGFIINFGKLSGLDLIKTSILDGLMLLSAPALLTSTAVKVMMRSAPFRRIFATALAGELVYGTASLISIFAFSINPFFAQIILLFGASLVFILWYVIARFIFLLKYRSILFAVIQLLFYLLFLFSNQSLFVPGGSFVDIAARYYISAFVLMLAVLIFFVIVNAPMKKNLGVSSTDAIAYLVSQWLYHSKDMEKAFESVGENAKTILSVMAFKRKKDTVFFVTPYVHYGPFGNLGGSEFSYLVAEAIDKKYSSQTFVFHGTVTHDLNPVSTRELDKITAAFDSIVKVANFKPAEVSISFGSQNECKAHALRINESALVSLSRAPYLTEDINFGLGISLIYDAERFVKSAMIVDQHNCETGEITSFEPGSPVGFGYLSALEDALTKKPEKTKLAIGTAIRLPQSEIIGKGGIKVAVISSKPEYVVVVIDCNGITPELRDSIELGVKEIGLSLNREFAVGVFTTDTHQLNMVRGVVNPLKTRDEVLGLIKEAVNEAASKMESCEFYSKNQWFDITVIGAKQSIELISTLNSIVAISKIILPLILLGGLLLLAAIATKL